MPYSIMDIKHHDRHTLPREELQRESIAYLFQLPDDGIAGYLYTWVDGFSRAGSAAFLYGPAVGETPIEVVTTGVEMPLDQPFGDWKVGEVVVRHHADESVDASFNEGDLHIDYHFEPAHPAYIYSCHPDGSPRFIAEDRLEQSGRIRGVIRLKGKEIPFDGMGHRDHSWGIRHWGIAQHWKWCETQAGPELAVHFMDIHAMGSRLVHGYVWRDGAMGEITGLDVKFDFDKDFFHTRANMTVYDELERETLVSGEVFARYTMKPHPMVNNHEGSLRLEIEGVPGVGHLEMLWQKSYLEYIREQEYMRRLAVK